MDKQEILKKYVQEEDRLLIAKILDKIDMATMRNYMVSTDFLNLHEQVMVEDLLKKEKIQSYFFFGGNSALERKMLFLYPDKLTPEIALEQAKNAMTIIRIELPKYHSDGYTHRDYLGGIMKLGIRREKIGDILTCPTGADIVVETEIAPVLKQNLQELTRFHKADMEILSIEQLRPLKLNYEEIVIIVPSYRMDSIVSEIVHTSRSKVANMIEQERIFVNFEVCLNRSKFLKIGDILSIRGKGRYEIAEEIGSTKKDNIRLKILKNS